MKSLMTKDFMELGARVEAYSSPVKDMRISNRASRI
jgi:hypothetical protein